MPNNFFSVESRFPHLAGKEQEEINAELLNYLFLLLEQLRYTLGNLGVGNFNESELDDIAEMISSPIYARIEDAEGYISVLTLAAEGLTSRVEDIAGNVSVLTQTSEGLVSRVSRVEGNVSALTQTADALSSRVSSVEGNVSVLTQTADALTSRVEDAEGNISVLTQTANSLTARVGNAELAINSLGVQMTGYVTFSALETAGMTTINGANITTGTITAVDIYGCTIKSESDDGKLIIFAYGSITIYNGDSMIGGIYPNQRGQLVIHGYGTLMDGGVVTFTYTPNVSGYDVLHTGSMISYLSENAATVKAALGIT